MNMRISKSKFCAGVQCLKRLHLLVHEPEIAAEPDGKHHVSHGWKIDARGLHSLGQLPGLRQFQVRVHP